MASGMKEADLLEGTPLGQRLQAIRCDHDGLKMAEVKDGHLILRTKHHGETHVKIVALAELGSLAKESGAHTRPVEALKKYAGALTHPPDELSP